MLRFENKCQCGRAKVDQFRAALKRAGLSQRDLAKRLGVTPETVNRWAVGRHSVPLYVEQYVSVLNGSISDYRGGKLLGYSFMTQSCHHCGDPAIVRVVRDNPTPPPGVMPGDIVTYYCAEHAPEELLAAVRSWADIMGTWPNPETREAQRKTRNAG